MTKPLRWGILGAAKIARIALAPAIAQADRAELAALATASAERAAPFLSRYPGLRLHHSYDALLADPDVDAVYVPLPNHLHVEWTLKAIAAGKHVLCEKPLALNAADIDRLIAARDASGLVVAEAFMVLHHPQWHRVRALLQDGAIGTLQHVEGMFTYHNTDAANIRNRPETGGGGLYDIGVYPAVTMRYATGQEPARIRADLRRENGVDVFARVWADFPEFTASFHCGMRQMRRQDMVFHGTTGWLHLPCPFNPGSYGSARLDWHRADGATVTEHWQGDQYALMVESFGAAVRGDAPFPAPLEFSRANQAMIDAILAAAP